MDDENKTSPASDNQQLDRETLRDWIREDLSSILPDFLKGDSDDGDSDDDDIKVETDKPLSTKDVEHMINKQMKEAMKVLQSQKPKKAKVKIEDDEDDEDDEPKKSVPKKSTPKEEAPQEPGKKFDLGKLLWGE